MAAQNKNVNPEQTLLMIQKIEEQAAQTKDPELKRTLLISGCEMIDTVLKQQKSARAA